MKKNYLSLVFVVLSLSCISAQDCDKLVTDGIAAYERKNYDKALEYFRMAIRQNCNREALDWIDKCYIRKSEAVLVKAKKDAEAKLQELIMQIELMKVSEFNEIQDSTKFIVAKQEALIVTMQTQLDSLRGRLPSASIEKIWIEKDVYNGSINKIIAGIYGKLKVSKRADKLKGVKIHLKFSTKNMPDRKGICSVYFYSPNRTEPKDGNDKYHADSSHISVSKGYRTVHKDCKFDDFTLFVPYNKLHVSETECLQGLKFRIKLFDDNNNQIAVTEPLSPVG